MWFSTPTRTPPPPFNALDEVADALHFYRMPIHQAQPSRSRELSDQFSLPITPSVWSDLAERLKCPLPPLQRRADRMWAFPEGWSKVDNIVNHVANWRYEWDRPDFIDDDSWFKAQIFVRVRHHICECAVVEKHEVHRKATLMGDLGMA